MNESIKSGVVVLWTWIRSTLIGKENVKIGKKIGSVENT
jgi:hypothetical protein